MIRYPPVNHKLPDLFKIIIASDHILERMKHEDKVVNLKEYEIIKKDRLKYSQAAEKYVQRQKTGSDNSNLG